MAECRTPELQPRVLEPCLPVFNSNGCSCQHWLNLHFIIGPGGRYHTSPVTDIVLDWAVTHQSDPFPYPYSTGPQWIRRPREALAKDPLSTTPRAADIEGVDGGVATERTVPVPKLGLPLELAHGPSSR